MFGVLSDSRNNLTEFFKEKINDLNNSGINISQYNLEEIIEQNSDFNLTNDELRFEIISKNYKEFIKEWDLFETCFYATFAFMMINLIYDTIMIIALNHVKFECLKRSQCLEFLCCFCYCIYLELSLCAMNTFFNASPLFFQFILFLANIFLIIAYLYSQHDKIKDTVKQFLENINCIFCENSYYFFEDLDKY